jgi:Holliday junction DNA helicase RuvA
MIGKLRGVVDRVDEETIILDVNGVGYLVSASARTLRAIPAVGEPTELLIETYVREDAIRLYGFFTAGEREWFRLLQSVQGVGAKVALGILGGWRKR